MKAEGLEAVEFGSGAYPGNAHVDAEKLLESKAARDQLLKEVESRGLTISAISVHGNPIHPVKETAKAHHDAFVRGVELAAALGVPTVNGFSGCLSDHAGAINPELWARRWPDEYRDVLEWQWKDVGHPLLDSNT